MLVVNLSYHAYMTAFCPSVSHFSYADNLSGSGASAWDTVKALRAAECFSDAWSLELDPGKTLAWATAPPQRKLLEQAGFVVVDSAKELGGFLAFGRAVRNKGLVDRFKALQPIFQHLSRAKCPVSMKLQALPVKFCARAMYGISGCPVSDCHLHQLRLAAVKALGPLKSGVSESCV